MARHQPLIHDKWKKLGCFVETSMTFLDIELNHFSPWKMEMRSLILRHLYWYCVSLIYVTINKQIV